MVAASKRWSAFCNRCAAAEGAVNTKGYASCPTADVCDFGEDKTMVHYDVMSEKPAIQPQLLNYTTKPIEVHTAVTGGVRYQYAATFNSVDPRSSLVTVMMRQTSSDTLTIATIAAVILTRGW